MYMSGRLTRATLPACAILPVAAHIISPKSPRLQAQIHRLPPRAPVNSYHCTSEAVLAKELPRTSQGQEIWAEVRYQCSQAIHRNARKIYGRMPLSTLLLHLNVPNINDIWKALASTAKIPPPTVALHTQNVVAAFHSTKAE